LVGDRHDVFATAAAIGLHAVPVAGIEQVCGRAVERKAAVRDPLECLDVDDGAEAAVAWLNRLVDGLDVVDVLTVDDSRPGIDDAVLAGGDLDAEPQRDVAVRVVPGCQRSRRPVTVMSPTPLECVMVRSTTTLLASRLSGLDLWAIRYGMPTETLQTSSTL